MDIRSYLRKKGIHYREVRRASGTQGMFPCPQCKDKSFSINLDTGIYSCLKKNKCGISGGIYKFQKMMGDEPQKIISDQTDRIYNLPKKKPIDPDEQVKKFFESRKINYKKAHDHFKFMKLGSNIAFRYFDYGEHVATKYRNMKEKEFYNEVGCKPALYNIDNCRDSDTLYICEGEMDCIALYDMIGLDAVSVPNGTGDPSWIEANFTDLESFINIVFIFDMDKAGQDQVHKWSARLGAYKCSVVQLPHNDVNDCLMQGMKPEEMCELVYGAKEVAQSQVVSCVEYTDEIIADINDPDRLRGIQLPDLKNLMNIFHGVRKPELTVITGQNHAGKSTLINRLVEQLIHTGEIPAIASLEMPPKRYLRWFIMQSYSAVGQINSEMVEKLLAKLSKRLYIIDIEGRVEPNQLLDHIEIACRKHGVTQVFIDSLMKIRIDRKDLLGSQIKFVDDFIDLLKTYNLHGWLVAHPRKGAADSDRIGKVDVGGAGHITDAADNVLTIYRPDDKLKAEMKQANGYAPASILSVKKCREYGTMGDVFMGFNDQNKKLFELDVQPIGSSY